MKLVFLPGAKERFLLGIGCPLVGFVLHIVTFVEFKTALVISTIQLSLFNSPARLYSH